MNKKELLARKGLAKIKRSMRLQPDKFISGALYTSFSNYFNGSKNIILPPNVEYEPVLFVWDDMTIQSGAVVHNRILFTPTYILQAVPSTLIGEHGVLHIWKLRIVSKEEFLAFTRINEHVAEIFSQNVDLVLWRAKWRADKQSKHSKRKKRKT